MYIDIFLERKYKLLRAYMSHRLKINFVPGVPVGKGADLGLYNGEGVRFAILCEQRIKALVSLHICTAYLNHRHCTKISCAAS